MLPEQNDLTRKADSQDLLPVLEVFCFSRMRVFETIMVSKVVNLCSFAHSSLRLRVFPVLILVSLTIVHVPHSGHFIGATYLAFGLLLPVFAKFLCPTLPLPVPTLASLLARLPAPVL